MILSRRNAIYLSNRINKLLFQTTEFHDQFKAIHVAIDDEEKIWNGTQYAVFKRERLVTFEARREIENALKVAEQVRLELIHNKEIIRGLN
ncbi:hypothetical protein F8M41_022139 [Gigaspora margarita]|uniref:Uncharacterized protein n=1 Tax=Gigaspora margarita TaxID=4874 RepID=A0A8H4AFK4_GIGMA|nr:hypothetical protein F8M41_022139 [Gigaspora margarita]